MIKLNAHSELVLRLEQHLNFIYPNLNSSEIVCRILDIFNLHEPYEDSSAFENHWTENDILMITYGDSIKSPDQKPLNVLYDFMESNLREIITWVHILPFFPYSSDDGFAVIDYLRVNDSLGSWEDIQPFTSNYKLMADLVVNHISSRSQWFENFKLEKNPGKDYFIEINQDFDTSHVVRPRATPLLKEQQTLHDKKEVWCTFSHDQIDLNFHNPEVLLEMLKIIHHYLDKGIKIFRLDAVAFLWKQSGSSCIHLQETHEIIKLFRTLIEFKVPDAIIITETNVPNRENLTYFGNSNEAHLIYNFSLPPLLIFTLITGDCHHLKTWLMSMPPARMGTTYLNFIASHDGIGLRPIEGLLNEVELNQLVSTMSSFGGRISTRATETSLHKPYEINISLYDALQGTAENGPDKWQFKRFICAHTIMLALEGVPAFYIHSLLGTQNDYKKLENTNQYRSINRHVWDKDELNNKLTAADSHHSRVLNELKHLLSIRKAQPAFHPNATQFTLHLGTSIFAFWRQSIDRRQNIFCLHNISSSHHTVNLSDINLISTDDWYDLISNDKIDSSTVSLTLEPYQALWLSNC
jgi:sucrose phosphorylase